jgi:general secretion pathway protein M
MATDALDALADATDPAAKPLGRGAGSSAPSGRAMSGVKGTWSRLGARERQLVSIVGALVAALLLWLLAVRPAWTAANDASARLPTLDAQLKNMQRLAIESKELRTAPRLAAPQAIAALKAATDTLGAAGKLTQAGERATLTLTNATGEQIQRWMVDARTTARARTLEAKLTRSGTGYSGTIVVALPAPN